MRAYNTSGLHRVHTLLIHTSLSSSTLVNAERRDRAESLSVKSRVVFVKAKATGGYVLVTEFRGMALNCLFCADLLRSLDLVPLTDFTYKYQPG